MKGSRLYRLCQGTGLLRAVEDFIEEDGEVEGQTQPDGMRWLHLLLADVKSTFVGIMGVIHRFCRGGGRIHKMGYNIIR